MPVLNPDPAAASLVSNNSTADSNSVEDRQSTDSFDRYMNNTIQELERPKDTMQFYPPSGAVR